MTSPLAQQIVQQSLGINNPYVIKLIDRILTPTPIPVKSVNSKYKEIETDLKTQIESSKIDILNGGESSNHQQLVLNSILLEKLQDRSALENSNTKNIVLQVLVVAIPVLTNLLQFLVTHFVDGATDKSDLCGSCLSSS